MRRTDREITDTKEMAAIIQKADTCHVALTDGGLPYIVALNYGVTWSTEKERSLPIFYFHCAPAGKKIDLLKTNDNAAFFIDTDHELVQGNADCDWGMKYKSVGGRGSLSIVRDPEEKKKGLDLIMNHYSGRTEFIYDEKVFSFTLILKMSVTEITGKKKI